MMIYINRKDDFGNLETVDEFGEGRKYAKEMLKEYRLSDSSAYYYMSQRPCKDWRVGEAQMNREEFFEWLYDTCPTKWTKLTDDFGNTTIKFEYEEVLDDE